MLVINSNLVAILHLSEINKMQLEFLRLNGLVVSALGIQTREPGFDSLVVSL